MTFFSNDDLDHLLKLRLVVARVGELDLAKWWNSKGQLGRMGAAALRRGLPSTHYFAQARSVFAIAEQRCNEIFSPPNCATLWRLPEECEQEFDARWDSWLERSEDWHPFFDQVAAIQDDDLGSVLLSLGLISTGEVNAIRDLQRSNTGQAVLLPTPFEPTHEHVTQLAIGFACGEPGKPAIPYSRLT